MAKIRPAVLDLIIIALLPFSLISCASLPMAPVVLPSREVYPQLPPTVLRQNVYHVVGPSETLWHISRIYDVKMQDIMQANNLAKPESLKMGQRLLIPQAAPLRPVIPLYQSNRWKYIIIHHSATEEGSALFIYKLHRSRGWQTVGYDFIISNGTGGKQDGHIEVSGRWLKQQAGAHCRASGMNYKGIGICLVGNFNKEEVSPKQMDSLVYLVNTLRQYYHIPSQNILGHGQVPQARTECPGKRFPWREFYSRLD